MPDIGMSPMFAEDIGWVGGSRDVVKLDHARCNCLSKSVERQYRMSLVELGMRHYGAIDYRLIITEEVALISYRHS